MEEVNANEFGSEWECPEGAWSVYRGATTTLERDHHRHEVVDEISLTETMQQAISEGFGGKLTTHCTRAKRALVHATTQADFATSYPPRTHTHPLPPSTTIPYTSIDTPFFLHCLAGACVAGRLSVATRYHERFWRDRRLTKVLLLPGLSGGAESQHGPL